MVWRKQHIVSPRRNFRVFSAKSNDIIITWVPPRACYIMLDAGLHQHEPAASSCFWSALPSRSSSGTSVILILWFSWRKWPNNLKTDLGKVINAFPFMIKCKFFHPINQERFQKTPVFPAEPVQHYIRSYKIGKKIILFL